MLVVPSPTSSSCTREMSGGEGEGTMKGGQSGGRGEGWKQQNKGKRKMTEGGREGGWEERVLERAREEGDGLVDG